MSSSGHAVRRIRKLEGRSDSSFARTSINRVRDVGLPHSSNPSITMTMDKKSTAADLTLSL
jgi:hypothetical protein